MNKKQVEKELQAIIVDSIGRDSENGLYTCVNVEEVSKKKAILRFSNGIPNLRIFYLLMDYFNVNIDAFAMEGDGKDFELSEFTHDHENWIDVTVNLEKTNESL